MKKILLFITLLLLLAAPAWASCGNGYSACGCGDTVIADWTLPDNLTCTNAGNALTVGANNITIDLGGHTITGDGTNTITGIENNGYTNVHMRNGSITNFTLDGTKYRGAATGTVTDIAVSSIGNQCFQNEGTANVTYTRITGTDCVDDGFSMHGSARAVINTATFLRCAQGINHIANSVLETHNVTITDSTQYDLYLAQNTGSLSSTHYNLNMASSPSGPSVYVYDGGGTLNIYDGSITSTMQADISSIHLAGPTAAHIEGMNINQTGGLDIIYADSSLTQTFTRNRYSGTPSSQVIDVTEPGSTTEISYSIFSDVMASDKFGVAVRLNTTVSALNNVFYDGGGSKDGKGIYCQGTCTVKNNAFVSIANAITKAAGTPTVDYNGFYDVTTKFAGTVTSTNEQTGDPLFVATGTDFRLSSTSPYIGTGVAVGLAKDYTGGAIAGKPEIGAYERRGKFF